MRRLRLPGILVACVAAWAVGALLPPPGRGYVATAALEIITFTAAVACGVRARRSVGRAREGWAAVSASATLWALGEGTWVVGLWSGRTFLTPSQVDPYFATSGAMLVVGLAILSVRQPDSSGRFLIRRRCLGSRRHPGCLLAGQHRPELVVDVGDPVGRQSDVRTR